MMIFTLVCVYDNLDYYLSTETNLNVKYKHSSIRHVS
jgi:hypothetical protein